MRVMKRRDFVGTVSLGLAAGLPAIADGSSAPAGGLGVVHGTVRQPLEFASALEAAEAIRAKRISSLELTEQTFRRIDKYNPQLNAFAYQLREEALVRAKLADQSMGRGTLGPLHGVPIHVKESFAVAGRPCTWGIFPH